MTSSPGARMARKMQLRPPAAPTVTMTLEAGMGDCCSASLVTGAAVIANNYFVSFISTFKHFFGGEMKGYSGMCSDARRLALVRMLKDAESLGANAVCNVRFETSTISNGDKSQKSAGVELIAYGTAFRRRGS